MGNDAKAVFLASVTDDTSLFSVKVRPSAQKTGFRSYDGEKGFFMIDIAAPPEDNKANKELVKFLAKLTKRSVSLVSGSSSRLKRISIGHR
ncbi:MAG: DUF167 domain-containing protein [Nanoarchaeota archaeon]